MAFSWLIRKEEKSEGSGNNFFAKTDPPIRAYRGTGVEWLDGEMGKWWDGGMEDCKVEP